MSVAEIAGAVRKKERSAVEVVTEALARIGSDTLGCFYRQDPTALEQARAVDEKVTNGEDLPLAGVPVALKDLFVTRGVETTAGSKILQGWVPPYDGTAVRKLREAGAVLVGKLSMDEFAMGSSNENSAYGAVRNPWDPTRVPGGSSGGSAAAVAAGLVPAALGTDTGGSIRQPAALSGVTGLKPTYGRVSRYGVVAFASSLDQVGPLGRSALDCAHILEAIAGFDEHDATSIDAPVPRYRDAISREVAGLTIGVPAEYFAHLSTEIASLVNGAIDELVKLGAKRVDIRLPHTDYGIAAYYIVATAEASSNLARYDGVRYGLRVSGDSLGDMYSKTRAAGFGDEVKRRIMLGTYALRSGYYDAYYLKAQKVRTLIKRDFEQAFSACDVIATPTAPSVAFKLGEKVADPLEMYLNDVFTIPCNLAGLPGMSIPCGFSQNLPVGLQLLGRPLGEETLFQTAGAYQRVTDWHTPEAGMKWEPVIGLEVHVQLSTKTKAFSAASAAFGGAPNHYTDPYTLALPGTLPVLNRAAVESAVKLGLATHSKIRNHCRFARKHYFYPDLPKGFQISQYDEPLCENGRVEFILDGELRSVRLTRIHMEEDAGKNTHVSGTSHSWVDYNRAGVPLCEVVSEPDIRSAAEAAAYLRAVRQLVRWLEISDGNMEEGSLRCDANVSVRPVGETKLGTKAELKNMNSFKHVEAAIEYEIARQTSLLERGERVVQETRLWNADKGTSHAMRSKESAHDYRYFPEPDLPPLHVSEHWVASLHLHELPMACHKRFVAMGLTPYDAGVLTAEHRTARYLDEAVLHGADPKQAANWMMSEFLMRRDDGGSLLDRVPAADLADLITLIGDGTISGKIAKDVLGRMYGGHGRPREIVEREGLAQVTDTAALEAACKAVVDANPKQVAGYRGGNPKLLGFFVGQVMKATQGKANPERVNEILKKLLT